jgi:hypothetical protein
MKSAQLALGKRRRCNITSRPDFVPVVALFGKTNLQTSAKKQTEHCSMGAVRLRECAGLK